MLITNEPYEQIEIMDNENETMALIQRRRDSVSNEWTTKLIIFNKRECLAIHQAITDHILSPTNHTIAEKQDNLIVDIHPRTGKKYKWIKVSDNTMYYGQDG